MLMIADTHQTDPRKNVVSAYPTNHESIAVFHHDTIPPHREPLPDPDDPPCPGILIPSPYASDEMPPLGLRLQALVKAHLPVAAAITKIHNLKQIRYTLHWQTGDMVRDTIEELVSIHSGADSWTMAYDSAEFLTVMPDCTLTEAQARVHQWQEAINSHPWQQLHPALQVTVAIGVAAQEPLKNYESLLADADVALRCSLS
jgi:diguanylate cyclase (GGDEF)-like protein